MTGEKSTKRKTFLKNNEKSSAEADQPFFDLARRQFSPASGKMTVDHSEESSAKMLCLSKNLKVGVEIPTHSHNIFAE